jgi:hypothetical protein
MAKEEKPYQDLPLDDLRKHIREISGAINDARRDLDQYRMTAMNADVFWHLRKAQNAIDGLVSVAAIKPHIINGQEVHGYSIIAYKVDGEYYGLKQFGHTRCEMMAQEQASIPIEEFEAFNYRVPKSAICKGCGKPILPDSETVS